MPLNKFEQQLAAEVADLEKSGLAKGEEAVVVKVVKPKGKKGPRVFLKGGGKKEFLRMNSNSYLGMALRAKVIKAEEAAAKSYGVGPGAVRFISGTYDVHTKLEKQLAKFHKREACMLTSAAYTSVLGVIATLTTPETIIVSDELNHNCIINAMKLARPKDKKIFPHLDLETMEKQISESVGQCEGVIAVTDGVFSMRGDTAPLDKMAEIVKKYSDRFPRGAVFVVDDSHGVGALGKTGRGTEELYKTDGVDILVATLGKAFGVNGGYIVSSAPVINYLREKNPFYIYTNPITPSEASAASVAIEMLQSADGKKMLKHLREMTKRFEKGLLKLGYETIPGEHPVTPLMVRDTDRTRDLVKFLRTNGILATGLNYPVVPKGDQLIRFQIAADHTPYDIDYVLKVLEDYKNKH
ncbi:MAG TPA: aminotransferase class I/II-fold pyridoxal phosphate-dependent enzyme [candidate division Zixibacteria bacterium]|nr:aminotransferase class I/II-fold pyridoxal phosphate-dependent enzyme [candidate division Zixibacteria bacterium]